MAAPANGSPYPSTSQAQPHKVPSLAPSQELAYRTKCIELRRRLAEIEKNNDGTRKRIQRERKAQDKMRLNRAILLHHIKDMMDNGRRLSPEQLQALSAGNKTDLAEAPVYETARDPAGRGASNGHDSDGTEEEEIAPPQERPLRSKRANHRGDVSMNVTLTPDPTRQGRSTPQAESQNTPHQSFHLPPLAPATSPVRGNLQSAFRVRKTGSPSPSWAPPTASGDSNQPIRPRYPMQRFESAQIRQGAMQDVPANQQKSKLQQMWQDLPESERKEWEQDYNEDMIQYEREMDEYKRARKNGHSVGESTPSGSFGA